MLDSILCVGRTTKDLGVVIDILPAGTFEGKEVRKLKKHFVRVFVHDLDEDLAEELKAGTKKLKAPTESNQFYVELNSKGHTTATNAELLQFVEGSNA